MEKTVYTTIKGLDIVHVSPRTLIVVPERMAQLGPDTDATMHVVYGKDPADRKIWVATFVDEQEAQAWVQGSKTFGRPVSGAVMAGQENATLVQGGEMSDGAVTAPDSENAKPS